MLFNIHSSIKRRDLRGRNIELNNHVALKANIQVNLKTTSLPKTLKN